MRAVQPEADTMITDLNACLPEQDTDKARAGALELWRQLEIVGNSRPRERLIVELAGRYRVGDGNEFTCEITDASPLGLNIKGSKIGRVGDWCLCNIASVGIVEGVVVQAGQHGFVAGIIAPQRRIRRLAERLHWQLRSSAEAVTDRRASPRREMNSAEGRLETADGHIYTARIFDVSEGGAALHLGAEALYFWVDQPVTFQGSAARVLRYFPGGIVIKYE
jgi:hypothetical protein